MLTEESYSSIPVIVFTKLKIMRGIPWNWVGICFIFRKRTWKAVGQRRCVVNQGSINELLNKVQSFNKYNSAYGVIKFGLMACSFSFIKRIIRKMRCQSVFDLPEANAMRMRTKMDMNRNMSPKIICKQGRLIIYNLKKSKQRFDQLSTF